MPTDEQDAKYEAEHIRQVARGLANTTLLDDEALFAANDPDRAAPVVSGTCRVDRPVEQIITGVPWGDVSPMDYANLNELEFPHATLTLHDLSLLSASHIRSRRFSGRVKTSQRARLATTDDWLVRCTNAPDGEQRDTVRSTAESFIHACIGAYQPPDQMDCDVLVYYCFGEIFMFILLSQNGDVDAWQFYTLGDGDK